MTRFSNVRMYGASPYSVVVVHGGPGAPGGMKSVAEQLSKKYGVLEPMQTADSVNGQIDELKKIIENEADASVILIGWSWGAWLSYLLSAKYPKLVNKLILISSGPFEEKYAEKILPTRLKRLSGEEKNKIKNIMQALQNKETNNELIKEFGSLLDKADSFDPIEEKEDNQIPFQPDIYQKVWGEASALRQNGELLKIGEKIICPVVAIHGDYDPHPAEGVNIPLSRILQNFRFILLQNCGHTPWKEKQAHEKFYDELKKELVT